MALPDWIQIHTHILRLEGEGVVTRTFRRLDGDRQEAILLAILEEAYDKGPTKINIKNVAARAGVSVGSLYTYFPNRDALLAFAVDLCVNVMTDSLESFRPFLVELSFKEALNAYLTGGLEWSQAYAGLLRLFVRAAYFGDPELAEPLVRPIANQLRSIVHDILTNAIARGEVRADIDLEATSRLIHALTIAVGDPQILPYLNTYFQVIGDEVSPDRTFEALVTLIVDGIGGDRLEAMA
jgi:AcrR family transcriptional regulator